MRSFAAAFGGMLAALLTAGCADEKKTETRATEAGSPADAAAAAKVVEPPDDASVLPTRDAPPSREPIALPEAPPIQEAPRGLPEAPAVAYNETTPEKVVLGELLFFDPRLSADRSTSCASCHIPELGWSDGRPRSRAAGGKLNLRHTPTLLNVGYRRLFAWDGAHRTLEAQILSNWRGQMNPRPEEVAPLLSSIPEYRAHFLRAFGGAPTEHRIAEALAAFLRTIRSGDAPWDRYENGGERAVRQEVVEGFRVFSERAGCALCHMPPLYTDLRFHNRLGRGAGGPADPGRYRVTGERADRGAFQTPGLRGVAVTAPYFHDGSAGTLAEAIDRELRRSRARGAVEIPLTEKEREALLAFLVALTPEVRAHPRPTLPPDPPPGDAGPIGDAGSEAIRDAASP